MDEQMKKHLLIKFLFTLFPINSNTLSASGKRKGV